MDRKIINYKYKNIEIAIFLFSVICWVIFIILFIKGFTGPPFKCEKIFENIYAGLLNPIRVTPFFAIPLIILSIFLKRKKGNKKIYKLGIVTFIITLIVPLLLLSLIFIVLMIGGDRF